MLKVQWTPISHSKPIISYSNKSEIILLLFFHFFSAIQQMPSSYAERDFKWHYITSVKCLSVFIRLDIICGIFAHAKLRLVIMNKYRLAIVKYMMLST